ncbi:DUF6452 family protein [uncultured Apibacter sp.]|uniref:DUF6452 family protein n=1 Tax=uncultured Apibacter sp. TaxID=1778616 RepID=UPI0025F53E16|nr:DUF6452 family protein [uncultured Apibacter sp.]
MFQKKLNLLFVLFFMCILVFSCVDDDVCDKVTTPRLTIELDSLGIKYKKKRLIVDRKKSDGSIQSEGIFEGKDSIQLPLNSLSDETVFYLYDTPHTPDSCKNIITIKYTTEQQFVSKACGFKVVYNGITYDPTVLKNIKSISGQTNQIYNESSTNLHIAY